MHPRKPMLALSCALLIAAVAPAMAKTRYVYLVNDTRDRIESLSFAPKGSQAWQSMEIGSDGIRGSEAQMLAIRYEEGRGCLYDARFKLRGGPTIVHLGVDFCKSATYRPGYSIRREYARRSSQRSLAERP